MSAWRQLTRGLRALTNRRAADQDVADEVDHYVDEAAAALEARGLSAQEARRAARLELGNVTLVREQVRSAGWEHIIDTMAADARVGIRRLRRSPLFTAASALTLALGIGASTAIFSAVNPILFQPLPYPDANSLMTIWDGTDGARVDITFGTYRELVERSRTFESFAVMRPLQVTLTGDGEPDRLDGQYVSASYFALLGVQPALGRDLQPSDDKPGAAPAAIISDTLWRRRFGSDPAAVGRQIILDGVPVTVIGVMPARFENVLSPSAEIWGTLQYDASLPVNGREWGHHLRMVGRLRPGRHPDRASQELDSIARTPIPAFPRPAWASVADGFTASRLQDDLTRGVRPALLAILGAVIVLLAIACVNVVNLLLARGAERRPELAVRAALGASRWRIVRQLLVETMLLSGLGGVLGIVVAHGAVDAVVALSPPDLPRVSAIAVDDWALVFALGLTSLLGLVIGIVPALQASGSAPRGGAHPRSARIVAGQHTARRALVVVQVALAAVLLVSAGLLTRSLQQLLAVPAGFDPANVLTMKLQTSGQRFRDPGATHQFFTQVLDAVQHVPGVMAVAFTSQLPLTGEEDVWGVHFESTPESAAGENRDGYRYAVSPGYFEAMGIRPSLGRLLGTRDIAGAPQVAVINQSFARRRLPGLNPIGQRLRIGPNSGPWFTVVGVVADVKQTSLAIIRSDAVYVTAAQWQRFADNARWLIIRARHDAPALAPAIRNAIQSIDRNQPILKVATMDQRLSASVAERRLALVLFEAFGAVALILAAMGTYSLLSGSVTERTREIGVRSALGASRRGVLALVFRQGLTLAGLGLLIGVAGAMFTSRVLVTMLFGISRLDATTYAGAAGLLAAVSVIACGLPAWQATRIPPSIALRAE